MRARIPASTLKRLEALEQQKGHTRPVALFPVLLPVDDWSIIASQAQAILKKNIREDTAPDYSGIDFSSLMLRVGY